MRKSFVSAFSATVAILLSLGFYLNISAIDVTFEVTLIEPVSVTAEGDTLSDFERQEIGARIQAFTQTAIDAFGADLPGIKFWVDPPSSSFSYSVSGKTSSGVTTYTVRKVNARIAVSGNYYDPAGMTDALNSVIRGFTPGGSTMLETVRSIHDFVVSSAVYDRDAGHCYSAFGALVEGRAVCEGYAEAFKLLCDYNGVPCVCVSGTGNSENHMWNYVRMDDGKWYAVDLTWDDLTEISYSYFLVGSSTKVTKTKVFTDNHTENGDLSLTGHKIFEYPELSDTGYVDTGKKFVRQDAELTWFYDQLDAEQKNFFDSLASMTPPAGSPAYVYTPAEPTETETETEAETEKQTETNAATHIETETAVQPVTSEQTVTTEPDATEETSFSNTPDTVLTSDETSWALETETEGPTSGTNGTGGNDGTVPASESTGASPRDESAETTANATAEKIRKIISYGLNVVVVAVSLILILAIIIVIVYRFAVRDREGRK